MLRLSKIASLLLVAACATAGGDRAPIDQRAAAARTSAEHEAVAREYQAYATRLYAAAQGSYAWGWDEERIARMLNEETPGQRPRWISLGPHWQMRALAEAKEADEAMALAREHRRRAISR